MNINYSKIKEILLVFLNILSGYIATWCFLFFLLSLPVGGFFSNAKEAIVYGALAAIFIFLYVISIRMIAKRTRALVAISIVILALLIVAIPLIIELLSSIA